MYFNSLQDNHTECLFSLFFLQISACPVEMQMLKLSILFLREAFVLSARYESILVSSLFSVES